jgi:ribonuclease T2
MRSGLCAAVLVVSLGVSGTASAQQVRLEGYFIALSDCAANKKKDSDNPGDVHLEVLRAYEMIGRNATPGTHYQVKVPGAPVTEQRWVPMSCGAYAPMDSLVVADGGEGGSGGSTLEPDTIEFVLAASWEPAFCLTAAGHDKPECASLTADRFDASHFALHGLWPDDLDDKAIFPCYCDRGEPRSCSGSLARDPNIDLSQAILDKLRVVMPGVRSGLHLHEWPKHGACYEDDKSGADNNADPDEYFSEAMALLQALNTSPVRALFAEHVGEVLTRDAIEDAFDAAFGAGAGERVIVRCSGSGSNRIVTELWIGLKGDVATPPDLAGLILAAPPTSVSSTQTSCAGGRVVAVTAE